MLVGFFQGGDPGAGVALGISLVECLPSEVPVSVDGVMSVPHTSRGGARRKTWVESQLGFGQGGLSQNRVVQGPGSHLGRG